MTATREPIIIRPHADAAAPAAPVGYGVPSSWRLVVVGAHGGAGVSTIAKGAGFIELTGLPYRSNDLSYVVVARTSAYGMNAARNLLADATLRVGADVLGLVLVPDAPGRLPKPLKEMAAVLAGAAPRVWNAPWIDELRYAVTASTEPPPALRHLVADLTNLRPGRPAGA